MFPFKEKPWLTTGPGKLEDSSAGKPRLHKAKYGLRVFLCVVSVLFLITLSAYLERMDYGDWRPLPEPWLLWLNTAVLIASSVALQWARVAAGRGQIGGVRRALFAGGILAWVFLAGQLWAWQQLHATGYLISTNPANAFFYMITAMHGLHLLGGLVAWAKTMIKASRGHEPAQVRLSVELCAVYWHFLLVVWLVFFGLMLYS